MKKFIIYDPVKKEFEKNLEINKDLEEFQEETSKDEIMAISKERPKTSGGVFVNRKLYQTIEPEYCGKLI